jgi:hypothetical protein
MAMHLSNPVSHIVGRMRAGVKQKSGELEIARAVGPELERDWRPGTSRQAVVTQGLSDRPALVVPLGEDGLGRGAAPLAVRVLLYVP